MEHKYKELFILLCNLMNPYICKQFDAIIINCGMHQIFKTCYQSWMPHWKYVSRTYSSIKTKTSTHPTKALSFSQPQTTILFSAFIQFKYPTEIESACVYPFVSGLSYLALSLQINAHCHKYKIFLF